MPPKAKGKRRRDPVKPISGLDIDALLGGERKGKVTPENAIPDFKSALDAAASVEEIEDAARQLGVIIRDLITESFGDNKYDQAMESFGVLREELINMEEPQLFNTFVKDLKKSLLSGALGGDRRDFWFKIRYSKLGLIQKLESEASDVEAEEAEKVCGVIVGRLPDVANHASSSTSRGDEPCHGGRENEDMYAIKDVTPLSTNHLALDSTP